jgi:hypothetical protein
MNLKEIHKIRRVSGILKQIEKTVAVHSKNPLSGLTAVQLDLEASERRLTIDAITTATPMEILMNAQRLANLFRNR